MDSLQVACLTIDAGADCAHNCQLISAGIQAAAKAGADILLSPECALPGYPGAGRDDYSDIDWCAYDGYEDLIHTRAQEAGIAVLLGTISTAHDQLFNDALWCGNEVTVTRYHKRCLTAFDKNFFSPGQSPCLASFRDWKIGITVCYDVRFPHTWGDVVSAGADVVLNIAHMAGPDPDPGVKDSIVPQHYASRAAEWATAVAMCNTSHHKAWLGNGAWDPRGMTIPAHQDSALQIFEIKKRSAYDSWYSQIHSDAIHYHQRG